MRDVTDYRHDPPQRQRPDTKPGHYYVSARLDGRYLLACGPFTNDHAAALAAVPRVRTAARESGNASDRKLGTWAAWGTARVPLDGNAPTLNADLREEATTPQEAA